MPSERPTLSDIQREDFLIPSDTAGIDLHLRNKRAAGTTASEENTILFVHGSTLPSEVGLDLVLDGRSFMDELALRGFDVWFVNIRGYGGSTRPPEMSVAADLNPPLSLTKTAVSDFGQAVDHVRKVRGLDRINLIGWSWGTTISGAYTAGRNETVRRLALIAPQWVRTTPSATDPGGSIGAYRSVTLAAAEARWRAGVPEGAFEKIAPDDWVESWRAGILASDPEGAAMSPPVLRAPNGTVQDSRDYWSAGRAFYQAYGIRVPVLQVHAEWDADIPLGIARAYFAQLTGAPYRRWVEIGEGTHSVMLEKNRWQVIDAVSGFFSEQPEG